MRRVAVSLLALPFWLPCMAPAQLTAGERVRVSATYPPKTERTTHTGTLAQVDSAALVVTAGPNNTVRVPREYVRAIEVSRGAASRGQAAKHGAVIGLGVGAGIGLGALVASGCIFSRDAYTSGPRCNRGVRSTGLVLAALSPLVGAVIGAARPGERWAFLPPEQWQAGVSAAPDGGVGIGLTLRF